MSLLYSRISRNIKQINQSNDRKQNGSYGSIFSNSRQSFLMEDKGQSNLSPLLMPSNTLNYARRTVNERTKQLEDLKKRYLIESLLNKTTGANGKGINLRDYLSFESSLLGLGKRSASQSIVKPKHVIEKMDRDHTRILKKEIIDLLRPGKVGIIKPHSSSNTKKIKKQNSFLNVLSARYGFTREHATQFFANYKSKQCQAFSDLSKINNRIDIDNYKTETPTTIKRSFYKDSSIRTPHPNQNRLIPSKSSLSITSPHLKY